MSETLYKVLAKNRMPFYGGNGQWPYRKWTTPLEPIPCEQGYHVCRIDQLINWLGPEIWVVETKGKTIDHGDKLVVESARLIRRTNWNEKNARLFSADCAEHVLHIYEEKYPNDSRPREAIQATRDFANGLITKDDMSATKSAAWSAARFAAESAARFAAESVAEFAAESVAEFAAESAAEFAAESAAESAVRAAWSAARAAAEFAAESAARFAAESAARFAAESAAEFAAESAAEFAAWSAAWSAARSAAEFAAWSEERNWQIQKLQEYL